MVDHIRTVNGGSGQMMIRENPTTVEFWIRSGTSSAFDYDMAWWGEINGSPVNGVFRYDHGGAWAHIGTWGHTTSGTVWWEKHNSGSTGLGGQTKIEVYISRSTVPPAPTTPQFSNIGHTTARVTFASQGDGGSGVLEWELHYGTLPSGGEFGVQSSGTTDLTGLKLATTYYAWARGRNANGWGPWSGRGSGRTLAGVWIRVGGVWKEAIAYVKVAGVWKVAIPYVKVGGVWKDAR